MMSDWEKIVDHEIRFWYESSDDLFTRCRRAGNSVFEPVTWQHLFDEEKQMVAEMYWETKLKD
tara:strand:+ start:48 stop:236 length:189 start_codon:yes stop_codon:yes gene_type:complete